MFFPSFEFYFIFTFFYGFDKIFFFTNYKKETSNIFQFTTQNKYGCDITMPRDVLLYIFPCNEVYNFFAKGFAFPQYEMYADRFS